MKLTKCFAVLAVALGSVVQTPVVYSQNSTSPAAKADVKWGKWTYIQSDKAVQFRVARIGQDGDIALLKYQLRAEPDSDISCYSDRCEGYTVHLPVFDPVARDIVATHNLFFPAGSTAVYDLPEQIHFPIRTTDTGRRFIDPATGLPMYEIFDNPGVLKVTEVLQGCVDERIKNYDNNRCADFDAGAAVTVGG